MLAVLGLDLSGRQGLWHTVPLRLISAFTSYIAGFQRRGYSAKVSNPKNMHDLRVRIDVCSSNPWCMGSSLGNAVYADFGLSASAAYDFSAAMIKAVRWARRNAYSLW